MDGGVILGLLVALLALWAALFVVLGLVRPRNVRPTELVRVVPDLVRLVRGLLRESFSAPRRERCRVSNDRSRIGGVSTSSPNSYQLFERNARCLSMISSVIARGRTTDFIEHRLFWVGADIAQR
jgi:hypothetical protein